MNEQEVSEGPRTRGRPMQTAGAQDSDGHRGHGPGQHRYKRENRYGFRHGAEWIMARESDTVLPPELPDYIVDEIEEAKAGILAAWSVTEHADIPFARIGITNIIKLQSALICLDHRMADSLMGDPKDYDAAMKLWLAVMARLERAMTVWGLTALKWAPTRMRHFMDGARDWRPRLERDVAASDAATQQGGAAFDAETVRQAHGVNGPELNRRARGPFDKLTAHMALSSIEGRGDAERTFGGEAPPIPPPTCAGDSALSRFVPLDFTRGACGPEHVLP